MKVNRRVSREKCAACGFVSLITRLKSTIASAAVSRNGRLEGAGPRSGPGPEPVGLGLARQPRADDRGVFGERWEA
jgi:hypothetical protein